MNNLKDITEDPGSVVMNYVKALDSKDYDLAASYIAESVRIIGPAGESFGKPEDFTNMLKRYQGKYNVLKMFADGDEVCLLYDFLTSDRTVYMSSWYRVEGDKIAFIRTVFDPSAFAVEGV